MNKRPFILGDSIHSKELVKLGFSDRLITTPEDCETYLNHCKKYDMKFLKGSYGTIVHKDFNKYFKESNSHKMRCKLACTNEVTGKSKLDLRLDHTNLFKSKIFKDVYILTSSPYSGLDMDIINTLRDYPYDSYIINPNFLDYHIFIRDPGEIRPPLRNVNYAFTNAAPEQIIQINKIILEDTGVFLAFDYLI